MILKKFLGKTVDAAKQSAQQMYGSDLAPLRSLALDVENEEEQESQDRKQHSNKKERKGVRFERSKAHRSSNKNKSNSKLKAIRKYAAQQMPEDDDPNGPADSVATKTMSSGSQNGSSTYYSRANIRPNHSAKHTQKNEDTTTKERKSCKKEFKLPDQPNMERAVPDKTTNSTEVKALHNRFDELESFLHSALTATNSDYAAHPAFQKLLHTGIHKGIITEWFSDIIDKGINPYDQTELFMSELTAIIRRALSKATSEKAKKYLLFTGLSGSGKTEMIMKLSRHPDLMADRQLGIVSVIPENGHSNYYYTILESFCEDQDIPYCEARDEDDILLIQEEWSDFDHILFDSPSLPKYKEAAASKYQQLQKITESLSDDLETHCLVDAARNEFYHKESVALYGRLNPDFIAVTHLDETSQWGPLIPLLNEVQCSLRYVSTGKEIPGSLDHFDPKWFTKTMLQNT